MSKTPERINHRPSPVQRRTARLPIGIGRLLVTGAALVIMTWSAGASAQGKAKDNKPRGIITLDEITITGRIQKPIAAVDVARIRPKLTLSELRQPFLERITSAIYRDPF